MARWCCCATLTLLVAASTIAARTTTAAAEPLRLSLECDSASAMTFRFTVRNVADFPATLFIGSILGNGKTFFHDLWFRLRRSGVADTNIKWFDPSIGVVGGTIEPWVIRLPAGASSTVAVSIPRMFKADFATPADVHVRLTTQPLNPFEDAWVGTLTSDWLAFPSDCRSGIVARNCAPSLPARLTLSHPTARSQRTPVMLVALSQHGQQRRAVSDLDGHAYE